MAKSNPCGTPAATQDDTIFVALELSQQCWLVALTVGYGGKISRFRLAAGDAAGLLQRIDRAQQGRQLPVVCCYEAGGDGFWLHRRLSAAGVETMVIDPSSLKVDRRARRRKTDRLDLQMILQALLDYWRGNRSALRRVAVPSPELEDARRPQRERGRLVKEATAHGNRMRALLKTLGIAVKGEGGTFASPSWLEWLQAQRQWNGEPVPPQLAAELGREHERLRLLKQQLAALTRTRPALPPEQAKQAQTLAMVKGVGPAISQGTAGEAWWHDFANRRQVGAYFGLDPSPWQSGDTKHDQGIARAGNRRARALMTEAAWLWLEHQPEQALSRWFKARFGQAGGVVRRIGIIALARKLAVLFWRMATTGVFPEDVVLKRGVVID
jgi:transposase